MKDSSMYILEFGKNKAVLYNSDDNTYTYYNSYTSVLDVPMHIPRGSILIIEYAHMGCPKSEDEKRSKAQPYTQEELFQFYLRCVEYGITFRLFPQQLTHRARKYAHKLYPNEGFDLKSEPTDAKAMYILLRDFPELYDSLKYPPKTFEVSTKTQDGWDMKAECTEILNTIRDMDGSYTNPKLPQYRFVIDHLDEIANELKKEEAIAKAEGRDVDFLTPFNLKSFRYANSQNSSRGVWNKGDIAFSKLHKKMRQMVSILTVLMDLEGNLKFRPSVIASGQKELPGKKFVKEHLFVMKAYHRRGGVLRSDLYHFGAKNWIKAKMVKHLGVKNTKEITGGRGEYSLEDNKYFRKYRQQYSNAMCKFYAVCKRIIEREHGLVVEQ
jgi:hypothetical protein